MSNKLYIGNLTAKVSKDELYALFSTIGAVKLVLLPTDHQTGMQKNYAFVEMETIELACAAVSNLNGHTLHQHPIRVTEIDPPIERRIEHSNQGGFRQQQRGGWGSNKQRR